MAYRCIFLLFYFVLTTYQRASAVNSEDRFLFVEPEKDILLTRKPSVIDFSGSSRSVNDEIFSHFGRQRRDINAISRSDNNLPRNISVQVSFESIIMIVTTPLLFCYCWRWWGLFSCMLAGCHVDCFWFQLIILVRYYNSGSSSSINCS